jgi:hypothetical protein
MACLSVKIRAAPIYLAALAVSQSQTIRCRAATEMLEAFGLHKGGKEYRDCLLLRHWAG